MGCFLDYLNKNNLNGSLVLIAFSCSYLKQVKKYIPEVQRTLDLA